MDGLLIKDFVTESKLPLLPVIGEMLPWQAIERIETIVADLIETLDPAEYEIKSGQAIHRSAEIEASAQLKGPVVIGPNCFVANGSLLRGGVILDANCIVGHCGELKTSIMFTGSKIAHLNFVGDSILGARSNVEGGAVIANYRNEFTNKDIHISYGDSVIATGVQKFGAILGDDTKVGANAAIAPGAILQKGSIVRRGAVVDQCKEFGL